MTNMSSIKYSKVPINPTDIGWDICNSQLAAGKKDIILCRHLKQISALLIFSKF